MLYVMYNYYRRLSLVKYSPQLAPPVFDQLQYVNMDREGLGHRVDRGQTHEGSA